MARRPARCYRYCKNKVSICRFCFPSAPRETFAHILVEEEIGRDWAKNRRTDAPETLEWAGKRRILRSTFNLADFTNPDR
jgi:hypothetical protein